MARVVRDWFISSRKTRSFAKSRRRMLLFGAGITFFFSSPMWVSTYVLNDAAMPRVTMQAYSLSMTVVPSSTTGQHKLCKKILSTDS